MNNNRYYTLNNYFKSKYKERVQKITVDGGFSCPNIDGTISKSGCIFCNNLAFSPQLRQKEKDIKKQIEYGIRFAEKRYNAKKYMVYFQPYTNTYGKLAELKSKYDIIKEFKNVVGLAIGTRPDCVDEEKLNLLDSYTDQYEAWIEYGLQSARDKTLKLINRGHDYERFRQAVLDTKKKRLKICVHVIIGLPKENLKDYIYTAKKLAELKVDGVKIHPAHVVKDTTLEVIYKKGKYNPISFNDYVQSAATMIEYLHSDCIIQRVGASAPDDMLLAPDWINEKDAKMAINNYLEERNSWQGKHINNK